MQSASSRIWTRVAVSISYDDNHYTTGTSILFVKLFDYTHNYCTLSSKILWIGRKICRHFKASVKKIGQKRISWRYPRILSVYRVTSNQRANSGLSPVELMFVRKIRSLFDKLLPKEIKENKKIDAKSYIFSLKCTETGKKSGRLMSLINVLVY